jgi:DNA-binding LacI/PurR family transcriptional regulator
MGKRVSLHDIARQTGYAVSTVSMALRDAGTMPEATRAKIKDAAAALRYYPNPLLAALASKQFSAEQTGETPLAYFHSLEKITIYTIAPADIRKWQDYARQLGYRLDIFDVADFRDGAHATQVLYARGTQGIILPPHIHSQMLPGMDWARFSVVGWGESLGDSAAAQMALFRVGVDHFGLVQRVWEETWQRGYRRIGFALFELRPGSQDDQIRWAATQSCLQRLAPRQRIPTFVPTPAGKEVVDFRELKSWMDRYRPDAVIGFSALFIWLLKQEGFRVPQDLGFAGLHVFEWPQSIAGSMIRPSGMKDVRMESMMAAVESLDQQIRHHQYGLPQQPRTVMIHSEWQDGDTLPHKNA